MQWCAADFNSTAPEIVELVEAWRIDSHTKRAVEGKLPVRVVEEIAKDAAFPPSSKKSLSRSSPEALAKFCNMIGLPVRFRPMMSSAPALAYIVLRDFQTGARINKLIAMEEERNKPAPAKPEVANRIGSS